MPQGLPGVASNINRPNSGWKIGSGSASLFKFSASNLHFYNIGAFLTVLPVEGLARSLLACTAPHPLPAL